MFPWQRNVRKVMSEKIMPPPPLGNIRPSRWPLYSLLKAKKVWASTTWNDTSHRLHYGWLVRLDDSCHYLPSWMSVHPYSIGDQGLKPHCVSAQSSPDSSHRKKQEKVHMLNVCFCVYVFLFLQQNGDTSKPDTSVCDSGSPVLLKVSGHCSPESFLAQVRHAAAPSSSSSSSPGHITDTF